jgi:phosphoribosylglycinamide formyltransferase 1
VSRNRIAFLASGAGSNLQAVMDACAAGQLDAEIVLAVSDKASGALRRAEATRIPALYLPVENRRDAAARARHDAQLAGALGAFAPDLVLLGGWMLLLGPVTLSRFEGRIINVHPALLPEQGGDLVMSSAGPVPALRGATAVQDALRHGLPVTGATVHVVTEELDDGPVILREEVAILPDDDETALHERIKQVEHRLLPRAAALMLEQVGRNGAEVAPDGRLTGGRFT